MVKDGPHSFLSLVPRSEDKGLISCAFRETMVAQTLIGPVHLSLVCEGKDEQQNDTHSSKSSPFEQAEAHLVETMFYDQWAPSGESSVSKPRGTFVPKWEDIQSDSELDLRELLARKRKRKEAPAAESDDTPQCVKVRGPDGRIVYKL